MKLRPIVITLGLVVLVMLSLRFVAEPMRVSSDSMSPAFSTGDEVLVQKLGAHAREPSVGDVVVVRSPASGDLVIKRVAALGGQTVAIADGVLKVDGAAVPESYVDRAEVDGTFFGPVRVPPARCRTRRPAPRLRGLARVRAGPGGIHRRPRPVTGVAAVSSARRVASA